MPIMLTGYRPTLSVSKPRPTGEKISQFTEGDLHGNIVRRLQGLIYCGAVDMDDVSHGRLVRDYTQLLNEYKRIPNEPSTVTALEQNIRSYIQQITIINRNVLVRSLEDYYPDRTGNMLLACHLEEHLLDIGVKTTRLASNHDMNVYIDTLEANNFQEFKERIERNDFYKNGKQGISTIRFVESLERMPLAEQNREFQRWKKVANASLLQIKLVDYSINKEGDLYIYTHGVPSYETLNALAKQFDVGNDLFGGTGDFDFNTATQEQKTRVIDEINSRFHVCAQANDSVLMQRIFSPGTAAFDLIWRREVEKDENDQPQKSTFIPETTPYDRHPTYSCYGHDRSLDKDEYYALGSPPGNVLRLDNNAGKNSMQTDDEVTGFGCDHTLSPRLGERVRALPAETIRNRVYQNSFDEDKMRTYYLTLSPEGIRNKKADMQEEANAIKEQLSQARKKGNNTQIIRLQHEYKTKCAGIQFCIEQIMSRDDTGRCVDALNNFLNLLKNNPVSAVSLSLKSGAEITSPSRDVPPAKHPVRGLSASTHIAAVSSDIQQQRSALLQMLNIRKNIPMLKMIKEGRWDDMDHDLIEQLTKSPLHVDGNQLQSFRRSDDPLIKKILSVMDTVTASSPVAIATAQTVALTSSTAPAELEVLLDMVIPLLKKVPAKKIQGVLHDASFFENNDASQFILKRPLDPNQREQLLRYMASSDPGTQALATFIHKMPINLPPRATTPSPDGTTHDTAVEDMLALFAPLAVRQIRRLIADGQPASRIEEVPPGIMRLKKCPLSSEHMHMVVKHKSSTDPFVKKMIEMVEKLQQEPSITASNRIKAGLQQSKQEQETVSAGNAKTLRP